MTNPIFQFNASLRVMNAPSLHDDIETQTGLVPSESHKNGDIRNLKTGSKWTNDIWIINSGLDKTSDLSEHLISLWNKIEPHIEYFNKLISDGINIDVFCGYTSDCDHAGFSVVPEALKIFIELNIPMEVSCILV